MFYDRYFYDRKCDFQSSSRRCSNRNRNSGSITTNCSINCKCRRATCCHRVHVYRLPRSYFRCFIKFLTKTLPCSDIFSSRRISKGDSEIFSNSNHSFGGPEVCLSLQIFFCWNEKCFIMINRCLMYNFFHYITDFFPCSVR